jgi:hypothetical protein
MSTKSLNEQVSDVMNERSTKSAKRTKLVKLGLMPHEVELLLSMQHTAKRSGTDFDFSKLTFGVEIESYHYTRESLISAGTANGLQVRSEGYNHHDNKSYFKIVSDSSLQGDNTNEVVSPILKGNKGLNSLKAMCDTLASVDARVNRSCGLHVHIGAENLSDEHYVRIVRNYQKLESVIDSFMPNSRRGNNSRWCHSLQGVDFSHCTTKTDVYNAMYGDRYYKVNAVAYLRHKTIEFRQHSGTVEYEKISNWVKFLAKLVEYSYKHEIDSCNSIEEIPFLKESEKTYFINRREALR